MFVIKHFEILVNPLLLSAFSGFIPMISHLSSNLASFLILAIELMPKYVKAIARRAKAYESIGKKIECLEGK